MLTLNSRPRLSCRNWVVHRCIRAVDTKRRIQIALLCTTDLETAPGHARAREDITLLADRGCQELYITWSLYGETATTDQIRRAAAKHKRSRTYTYKHTYNHSHSARL